MDEKIKIIPRGDKHLFDSTNHQRPNACVRCGLPPHHTIHHQIEKSEPEIRGLEVILDNSENLGGIAAPDERIGRHELFLEIATILRKRSTCNRGKVGCVITQDRRIVSTGYNGSPAGAPHCLDIGCEPHTNEHVEGCFRTVHAEANCIAFAAKHGVSTGGGTMYSTHSPCHECAKLIVSAGIVEFYFTTEYRAQRLDVLTDAGIIWWQL